MPSATPPVSIERLSRQHSAALLSWARGRFSDERDAEEVVADTLVQAWRRYELYDPGRGSERAWLFGIARNAAADHHRRGGRRTADGSLQEITTTGEERTDEDIDRLVEFSHVRDALDALSDAHRTAIVDAYFNGHTTTQIAARLRLPPGTVKSRLYYALKAMRSHLEERGIVT